MSIQTKLTKEIAFAAMGELHTMTGAKITVSSLLNHLGKGSKSTLTPWVSEWKVDQLKRMSACENMPSELKGRMFQMLSQIWVESDRQSDDKIESMKRYLSDELEVALKETFDAIVDVEKLESQSAALETSLKGVSVTLEAKDKELQVMLLQCNDLSSKNAVNESLLAERDEKISQMVMELLEMKANNAKLQNGLLEAAKKNHR